MRLIEGFLTDTKAVVPVPNPAFDPSKYHPELELARQAAAEGQSQSALRNLPPKAKTMAIPRCKAGRPAIAKLRSKTASCASRASAASAFSASRPANTAAPRPRNSASKPKQAKATSIGSPGGVGSKEQRVDFTLKGGDWEEITVELPAEGPLGIVRLYLPMQEQAVEIDWIELTSKNGSKLTRTGF
jgi:hypothetical protein